MNALSLTDPMLTPGETLLSEGRAMARDWKLGSCLFLEANNVTSEVEYKRRKISENTHMQHAHIGFRSVGRTSDGMAYLYDKAGKKNVNIDRFGVTLDWSMGYPPDNRAERVRGTGIVLNGPEDFSTITNATPAASHFGDFGDLSAFVQ